MIDDEEAGQIAAHTSLTYWQARHLLAAGYTRQQIEQMDPVDAALAASTHKNTLIAASMELNQAARELVSVLWQGIATPFWRLKHRRRNGIGGSHE